MYERGKRCVHFNVKRPCYDMRTQHSVTTEINKLFDRMGLQPIALVNVALRVHIASNLLR